MDHSATIPDDKSSANYVDVCAASDVPEGELKGVSVGARAVVLGRVEGRIYAIGGECTHQEGLLEDGELDGFVVHCPLHDGGFDIRTGRATHPPAHGAEPAYDVKVENGRVFVSREPR